MNVIIANKNKEMLMSLDIEVIKSMEGEFDVEEIIDNFTNFYYDKMILDVTALKNYNNLDTLQKLSINLDANKIILVLDNSPESEDRNYLSKLISLGFYNFTRNYDGIKYLLNNPHSYRDVANLHIVEPTILQPIQNENEPNVVYVSEPGTSRVKIIGLKNLTDSAGATTLTYLLKKNLEANYSVVAIEVDKRDFTFFEDETLISTSSTDLPKELMKHNEVDVILVDLNNYKDIDVCTEVLCLVEPSTIKLNKLMKKSKNVFEEIKNEKIVLNKSFVRKEEEKDFEYEAKTEVFANIPPINDREIVHESINLLLNKLGLRQNDSPSSENSKLFGLFKV